jgi:hypothetical protein
VVLKRPRRSIWEGLQNVEDKEEITDNFAAIKAAIEKARAAKATMEKGCGSQGSSAVQIRED